MQDEERIFFEHDVATPLTNLAGAHYLLTLYIASPAPEVAEALDIIKKNTRTMERMLGWYWRTRRLKETLEAVSPWSLSGFVAGLARRIDEEKLPIAPPTGEAGKQKVSLPREELETGLLGACLSLFATAEKAPVWSFKSVAGACEISWTLDGDRECLDPARLMRKVFIPSNKPVAAWVDPGLPYLKTLLEGAGGNCGISWEGGVWRLTAVLPTLR